MQQRSRKPLTSPHVTQPTQSRWMTWCSSVLKQEYAHKSRAVRNRSGS